MKRREREGGAPWMTYSKCQTTGVEVWSVALFYNSKYCPPGLVAHRDKEVLTYTK